MHMSLLCTKHVTIVLVLDQWYIIFSIIVNADCKVYDDSRMLA